MASGHSVSAKNIATIKNKMPDGYWEFMVENMSENIKKKFYSITKKNIKKFLRD